MRLGGGPFGSPSPQALAAPPGLVSVFPSAGVPGDACTIAVRPSPLCKGDRHVPGGHAEHACTLPLTSSRLPMKTTASVYRTKLTPAPDKSP